MPVADPLHGAAVRTDRSRHYEILPQIIANFGPLGISCLVSTLLLVLLVVGYSANSFQRQRRIVSKLDEAKKGK
jgi:hypothetical protein